MDPFRPLFIMNLCIPVADDFLLEILPRCAINRDLSWKQSELYYFFFFFKFNWIFHCKQPHFTIYFPKQRDIIVFISDDRHWPRTIASQYISYPSALVSACQMLNWPNKFLIWSSTSTLALSIGTLQRNASQITDKI